MLEIRDHLRIISGRLRAKKKIEVVSWNDLNQVEAFNNEENIEPLLGVCQPVPNCTAVARKRSRLEVARSDRTPRASNQRRRLLQMHKSNDLEVCEQGRRNTKSCGWCSMSGHQRNNCPKAQQFSKPNLGFGKSSLQARYRLSEDLSEPSYFVNVNPPNSLEAKQISSTIPQARGMVIHSRFLFQQRLVCCCSFLKQGLEVMDGYQNVHIFLPTVTAFITKGASSFVVSELEVSSVTLGLNDFGVLAEGILERLSQSSLNLSQLSQLSLPNTESSLPNTEDI